MDEKFQNGGHVQRQRKDDFKAQMSSLSSDCTWLELRLVLNGMTTSSMHSSCFLDNKDPPSIFLLSIFPFIIIFFFHHFLFFSFFFSLFFSINLISSPNLFLTNPLAQMQIIFITNSQIFRVPNRARGTLGRPAQGVCGRPAKPQYGSASVRLLRTSSKLFP